MVNLMAFSWTKSSKRKVLILSQFFYLISVITLVSSQRLQHRQDAINEWIRTIRKSPKAHSLSPSWSGKSPYDVIGVSNLPLQNEVTRRDQRRRPPSSFYQQSDRSFSLEQDLGNLNNRRVNPDFEDAEGERRKNFRHRDEIIHVGGKPVKLHSMTKLNDESISFVPISDYQDGQHQEQRQQHQNRERQSTARSKKPVHVPPSIRSGPPAFPDYGETDYDLRTYGENPFLTHENPDFPRQYFEQPPKAKRRTINKSPRENVREREAISIAGQARGRRRPQRKHLKKTTRLQERKRYNGNKPKKNSKSTPRPIPTPGPADFPPPPRTRRPALTSPPTHPTHPPQITHSPSIFGSVEERSPYFQSEPEDNEEGFFTMPENFPNLSMLGGGAGFESMKLNRRRSKRSAEPQRRIPRQRRFQQQRRRQHYQQDFKFDDAGRQRRSRRQQHRRQSDFGFQPGFWDDVDSDFFTPHNNHPTFGARNHDYKERPVRYHNRERDSYHQGFQQQHDYNGGNNRQHNAGYRYRGEPYPQQTRQPWDEQDESPRQQHDYPSRRTPPSSSRHYRTEKENEILGSGNFEVLKGGTFYEPDTYYNTRYNDRPSSNQYRDGDFFENFRDFADIKNDLYRTNNNNYRY